MKLLPNLKLGVLSLTLLSFMVVNARDLEISKKSEFKETDYVFFNYNDLRVGAKMPIYFGCVFKGEIPHYLPKENADMIPLSSHITYCPESPQAKAMMEKRLIKMCESNVDYGGAKKCVTSLESMIYFVSKSFKTYGTTTKNNKLFDDDLKVLSTSPLPKSTKVLQTYTIVKQPKRLPSPNMMACHMMTYPYAMYFCHYPEPENRVYEIALVGEDGTHVDAVTTCHMNTAHFEPDLAAFRMFGTKPGDPVCHIFTSDVLLWLPAHAQSETFNVANGQKYMGEYWGAKAFEARLNDGQKYWGSYSLAEDLKPKKNAWEATIKSAVNGLEFD